jgi:hypothetical protein
VRLGELLNEGTVSASEQCNAVDPFSAPEWTVEQCAPTSLVPRSTSPHDLLLGRVNVLLAIVDQPRVPFLKQVEQVLLQLHASMQIGMLPAVFMGSTAFVPSACAPRRSPYQDDALGANAWDHHFAPLTRTYAAGDSTAGGRPVRLFVASASDIRNLDSRPKQAAIARAGPVAGGGAFDDGQAFASTQEADSALGQHDSSRPLTEIARRRLRMARLVRRFLRVKSVRLRAAAGLLRAWRERNSRLLGIAMATAADSVRPPRIEALQRIVSAFLHSHGAAAQIVVVGASPAELHTLRQRHGAQRLHTQDDGGARGHPCGTRDSSRGSCRGHREIVDGLLLAHCDYLITAGHPAAEFAMWYNPQLLEAHLDLDEGTLLPQGIEKRMLPTWVGGTWSFPTGAREQSMKMLDALNQTTGTVPAAVRIGDESTSAMKTSFEPGLPAPVRRREKAIPWVEVLSGTCHDASARRLRMEECRAYATTQKKHFLGRSIDRNEYPGCTIWLDTLLVEFNDHADDHMGCNLAGRGKCICTKTPRRS